MISEFGMFSRGSCLFLERYGNFDSLCVINACIIIYNNIIIAENDPYFVYGVPLMTHSR